MHLKRLGQFPVEEKICYLYEKEENLILINFKQVCIKSSFISFVCHFDSGEYLKFKLSYYYDSLIICASMQNRYFSILIDDRPQSETRYDFKGYSLKKYSFEGHKYPKIWMRGRFYISSNATL